MPIETPGSTRNNGTSPIISDFVSGCKILMQNISVLVRYIVFHWEQVWLTFSLVISKVKKLKVFHGIVQYVFIGLHPMQNGNDYKTYFSIFS